MSFPSVVAASPATSRAHVYSATTSWKNAISSALSEIAAARRCGVSHVRQTLLWRTWLTRRDSRLWDQRQPTTSGFVHEPANYGGH
ncbi:hypothetical protein [Streptomyces sp. CB02400]|uniref:hypothetical protein n=1 Tax=Streptomyces sp. CB02400 TaxID=1703944 RepID=UPI00143167F6|nr:hypothetical protein [Streptomyces sp. CB02400]